MIKLLFQFSPVRLILFLLALPFIIVFGFLAIPFQKKIEEQPRWSEQRLEQLKVFLRVISNDDRVLETELNSILRENLEDTDEAFIEIIYKLVGSNLVNLVDHRSPPEEVLESLVPLIEKRGGNSIDIASVTAELGSSFERLPPHKFLNMLSKHFFYNEWVLLQIYQPEDNIYFWLCNQKCLSEVEDIDDQYYEIRKKFKSW